MENNIFKNPKNEVWFICWNCEKTEIIGYGSILPKQQMETNSSHKVDIYETESIWKELLLANSIDIDIELGLDEDLETIIN